jgi:malonyl-CoA O-methyltransferase
MPTSRSEPLSPAAAYRLWAPTYAEETAVSALEDRIARDLLPDSTGRRILDVGCGIGRRLVPARETAGLAVGLDLVPDMLLAAERAAPRTYVAGDVSVLPFADGSFDLLWCRLVLGHVSDLTAAYREMARVSAEPSTLLVSDFHPRAVAAGHTRSFRDRFGVRREIEHRVHEPARHEEAAARAGWRLVERVDAPAGEQERAFYERTGRSNQFELERGLPLVLVMRFALR